ncbi:hypothetical protein GUJ93_ZPchr0001g31957 [Zizania palustris]|uniref:Uncharacterized protein n=1 Tax=Zizania palustris TaxID=103762 RepID=A0A8J5V786_ZIZPA|nr:hypothetical protein GUJ93_ZPchr0001g31957 [Zizania palustris]
MFLFSSLRWPAVSIPPPLFPFGGACPTLPLLPLCSAWPPALMATAESGLQNRKCIMDMSGVFFEDFLCEMLASVAQESGCIKKKPNHWCQNFVLLEMLLLLHLEEENWRDIACQERFRSFIRTKFLSTIAVWSNFYPPIWNAFAAGLGLKALG